MPSVWIRERATKRDGARYLVEFKPGGREAKTRHAGSFKTKRHAIERAAWVSDELRALRMPDLRLAGGEQQKAPTVDEVAEQWLTSRIDVAEATRIRHRSELQRISKRLGSHRVDELTPAHVVGFVSELSEAGYARGSIKKTLQTVAMILDHVGATPNPARDRKVRLPIEEREELNPPTAEHVEEVFARLPDRHRLAFLWLDWSGARVGSLDSTLVGDYDQPRRRIRVRNKRTRGADRVFWSEVHPVLAEAIEATLPHPRFRDPEARLFDESGADALRTAIAKACKAATIPLFSPHDLRHRRVSLLHLRGVPWARIAEFVGQRDLKVTADTYTHVLTDERELDYAELLAS